MKKALWNSASTHGLILSAITIATLALNGYFMSKQTAMPQFLSLGITLCKLVLTIWLLYHFMKRFGLPQETYTYGNALSYGFATSFASNVFVAVYCYFHFRFLFPSAASMLVFSLSLVMGQMGVDTSAINTLLGNNNFPALYSIAYLIYMSLYALIVSAILAIFAKKSQAKTIF